MRSLPRDGGRKRRLLIERALDVVKTMDADAQETLRPKVEKKIAGL